VKYLSVCAGIEAASVAWHSLGWEAVGHSEIEPFPSAVLKHHYPNVTNFGDMTKFKEWNLEQPIDLLVGGTPCQSFSVAGLRKGLEDPRGNLALVYCGILDHFRPQWFVWENVPGVLSSNGGRDFGSFLGALAELGYGFAYRVLDAQYFGVAQRRRRVFVVGYLGDWRPAAEVLFERESVRGDSAPSREKRQEVAKVIAPSLTASNDPSRSPQSSEVTQQVYSVLQASYDMKQHHNPQPSDTVQLTTKNCSTVRGDTPLVQPIAKCLITKTRLDAGTENLIPTYAIQGSMIGRSDNAGPQGDGINEEVCFTQNTTDRHAVAQPIAFISNMSFMNFTIDGVSPTLKLGGHGGGNPPAITQPIYMGNAEGGAKEVPFLTCHNLGGTAGISNQTPLIGQPVGTDLFNCTITGNISMTLKRGDGNPAINQPTVMQTNMAVRRLTPVECERLQGFPDNYTNIPWRKAAESPDGPRYKALGNSMAVPVMAWIGQRIANYS
jgi:DNA (cytosine-5)-methyltransferase 1